MHSRWLNRALLAAMGLAAIPAAAVSQDLTGRWSYEENGQAVELDLRHQVASGRVTGSLIMAGASAELEATFRNGSLTVARLGGVRASSENGTMTGRLRADTLELTITEPGQTPLTVPLTRARPSAELSLLPPASHEAAPSFAGHWEATSDDSTDLEVVELEVHGAQLQGRLTVFEKGYFSGKVTQTHQLLLSGTIARGVATLSIATPEESARGTARIRDGYLVLAVGENESGYTRSGVPLVRDAAGSVVATALEKAITGRVYESISQAQGRGAAVGGRVRAAFCSDGRLEYDASDLASTPGALPGGGVDLGSTITRRGTWEVVLYAGAPVVRAHWQGTGMSYRLTRYFRVAPQPNGTIKLDGITLHSGGRC